MGKQAIKIGILEDKEKEINILEDMLYDIAEENDIKIDIEFASQSWKDFMDNLQHYIINTCFLDIDLNTVEMNGMDVAEKIDEMDKGIKIIFITGHNQYMGNAFKVSTFDYLHKPLNKEDLRNTLIRLNAKLVKPVKCLEIYAQEYIRIPYRDMAIVAAILSITTIVATLVASSACVFFILHDGGDEAKLPEHLKFQF